MGGCRRRDGARCLRGEARRRIEELLERYRLAERRHQLAGTLSGGERQRLALAGTVLHRPDLLFLDEPTSAGARARPCPPAARGRDRSRGQATLPNLEDVFVAVTRKSREAGLLELWPALAALGAFILVMLGMAISRVHKRLD